MRKQSLELRNSDLYEFKDHTEKNAIRTSVKAYRDKISKKDIFAAENDNNDKIPKLPQIFNKINNQIIRYHHMNLNLKQS